MLISIKEYADKHGVSRSAIQNAILRQKFSTAKKIGRNWVIDSEEPYIDQRLKSGKYIKKKNPDSSH